MAAAAAVSAQSMVRVVIDTEHGEIEVAIDQGHGPGHFRELLTLSRARA